MNIAKHYINGKWITALTGSGKTGDILNPATSELAAKYCDGTVAEIEAAVAAAKKAFFETSWRENARIRADVLLQFADNLEARKDEVADLLVTVNGKLRREALGETMAGVSELRYYAGLARNLFGRVMEVEPGCYSSLDREPAGVAAIILPWNAPVTLLVRSLAPAMAAGCTSVIKPAAQTSVVNNMVLECVVDDPRVPPGVINSVIESGSALSQYLSESPDVNVLSYTGSSRVGKLIAEASAPTLKKLSLELGGKAPAVVFEDCDVEKAVAGIVNGGLILAGQQCTAIARVIVAEPLFKEFSQKLVTALKNVKVGLGTDPQSQMGSMIDTQSRDRIAALVEKAEHEEKVLLKGEIPSGPLAKGAFIRPSLVEVENLDSKFIQDELFGPLMVIEHFKDEADAIRRSNATRYSLAASVWTQDGTKARRVASKMNFGTVWRNAHNRLFPEAETGGYGDSGYGKLHGQEGLNDFMQTKHFYYETEH
ncbi:MAG: aldehyde dehydrogenase family protein [Burkholderiaceae bacterium]|nr:MAG: aldehyde dehydrogenase family protein [Burkholderiaceae bacterium]TAM02113.1 MAG: aldehyde dehydrogenase family protein [Pusillimonas sp.]